MTLDPHVAQLVAGLGDAGTKSFEDMSIDEARAVVATFTGLQAPAAPVARIEDAHYLSDGIEIPLRIYVPDGTGPRPLVLYLHGGGFVAGDLSVVDEPARAIAHDTGAVVVTATYRRAPEHRFPAASDDAWAALRWAAAHAADYGVSADDIVIAGDSAGGNLAAVTALRARDEGGPRLRGQVLIYPIIDPAARFPSRSEGYLVTAAALDWFWNQYLASPADAEHPYAVPCRADLRDLPPTLVLTTEHEVSRDEAEHYGDLLRDAGVDARTIRFDGLIHGVFWMSGAVPRSRELLSAVSDFVAAVAASTQVGQRSPTPDP